MAQYSYLENPMNREAWSATVHSVTKSRTRLKWLSAVSSVVSCVWLFATPRTAAHQVPVHHQLPELSQTHVHRVVMPSNHLIFCCPLLLLPSIFPSIRVFSNESVLRIRWPKYWSFSFSISPANEYSRLISLRTLMSLQSRGLSRVFSNTTVQKHQFFGTQLYGPALTSIHDYWKRLSGKERACQYRRQRRCGFDPWLGRSPGRGNGNPLQYSCLGNPRDRGAWRATDRGVAELDTTEHTAHTVYTVNLHIHWGDLTAFPHQHYCVRNEERVDLLGLLREWIGSANIT